MHNTTSVLVLCFYLFLSEVPMNSGQPALTVPSAAHPDATLSAETQSVSALPDPRDGRLAFVRRADQLLQDGELDCSDREFKGWVANRLDVTPRVAGRWIRTARYAPLSVQDAVDDQRLDITTAEQVVRCSKETQQQIEERIEAEEDPRTVINGYLSPRKATPVACVRRMLKAMNRCMNELDGRFEGLPPLGSQDLAILVRAGQFIQKLSEHDGKVAASNEADLAAWSLIRANKDVHDPLSHQHN